MIAAIYARKSTEQTVADDQKSVARQIAHAREYATRKGWTVDESCVFVDDGISGAEFAKRPGFVRLMNALSPLPRFQVLVMSEESRLGRESIEVSYALKQIVTAGVRTFFYLEDRERTLDSAIDKAMLALQTMADEIEREKAGQRMVDTMARKARAGHVTGGQCFGYDNVPVVGAAGERSHVVQRINEAEAVVIRRIFELAASGCGQVQIAKRLNAEGTPAPRSQRGRPRAWVSSSVHEALFRPRYRGEIVWNRTKKRDRWGKHRVTNRPADQWMRVAAPHLRIVPEELWQAAHAKIAEARASMNLYRGRGSVSRYLLPGLARCAWCNGGLYVRTRTRVTGEDLRFYACSSHFHRGEAVCRNLVQLPMASMDAAVLAKIDEVLTPDLVGDIVVRVRELVEAQAAVDPRIPLEAELAGVEAQLTNVTDAIAMGGHARTLVQRLQGLEDRRQRLEEELVAVSPRVRRPAVDWRVLERQARRVLADRCALLRRHVDDARDVLREMLDGPLRFTPILEERRRGYRFEGELTIGGILAGNIEVLSVASPGRIELPA